MAAWGGYDAMRSGLGRAEHSDPVARRARVFGGVFILGHKQRGRPLVASPTEMGTPLPTKGQVTMAPAIEAVRVTARSDVTFSRKGV
jgi:hypothetical protein